MPSRSCVLGRAGSDANRRRRVQRCHKDRLGRLVSNTRIESNDRSSEDVDSVLSTLMKMLQQ
jgi:hypothetical protein